MKNSIYLLMMFFGLALVSCEPMEDLHNEVDDRIEGTPIVGVEEYTLTADDYAALELDFGNFSSLDDAAALIPGLLAEKFPLWGEGSLAQVTFDLFAPITFEDFTVTSEGYEAIELDRNYFVSTAEIKDFLTYQFPQARLNDYVRLTYRTVAVEESYELSNADFDLIETELSDVYPIPAESAGDFSNFDIREGKDAYWSNEMILEALNVVLQKRLPGIEGQTYEVTYRVYTGSRGDESINLKYDGTDYVPVAAAGTPYEFTDSDFELLGAALMEEYPGPAENAADFGSFDVRTTSDNFWSVEMILEAANVVLLENFPDAAEGTQFDVTYEVYKGGSSTTEEKASFVLTDGEYVAYEPEVSTVVKTSVFARGNNSWTVPIVLPEVTEDYDIYKEEFQQENSYFSSESTAGFYIGRWLEPQYPYAQEGDFISVKYEYSRDRVRYASFVYTDREWQYIPTVIPYTLQFGYEDTGWVVDNTIVYVLTDSDYEYIEAQLIDEYPGPADSAGWFKNFDRRPGNANQWTDEMMIEAMNLLLNGKVAPNAEEGQKYLMTYDVYIGRAAVEQLHLIKTDGEWVPVE